MASRASAADRADHDDGLAPIVIGSFERMDASELLETRFFHSLKQLKHGANEAYRQGDYERAMTCYLAALGKQELDSDPTTESLLLSNAAACRLQLFHQRSLQGASHPGDGGGTERRHHDVCDLVEAAIADARRCTHLNPLWAGGHLRLAQALIATCRRDASNAACTSLHAALELDPDLAGAKRLLRHQLCRDGSNHGGGGGGGDGDNGGEPTLGTTDEHDGQPHSPRYVLDETAVVTCRDRVALSCRRAKRYLQVNRLEICVMILYVYFASEVIDYYRQGVSVRTRVQRLASRRDRFWRLVAYDLKLFLYRVEYDLFKSIRQRSPENNPRPESSPTSGDDICGVEPLEPMWFWITAVPGSSIDQCDPAEMLNHKYM